MNNTNESTPSISYYPHSLTQQPNGTYRWFCSIDPEYYRATVRPGFIACVIIAVFVLAFGALLSYMYHNWMSFWIVAGCAAVFMLISVFFFWLDFHFSRDPQEQYELSETYVKTGTGKSSVYFDFVKVKQISFTREYIELRGKTRRMRVYTASEEDMEFVKKYIMNRLPGDVEIRYGA